MKSRNYLGKEIDILGYSADQICLESIGHCLSRIPRFGGNTKVNYTVMHHTILGVKVCELMGVDEEVKRSFFSHDLVEGVTGSDVITPVKIYCRDYNIIEDNIVGILFERFDCSFTELLHDIDYSMGYLEACCLMKGGADDWDPPAFNLFDDSLYENIVKEIHIPQFTKYYKDEYKRYCLELLGEKI